MLPFHLDEITKEKIFIGSREYTFLKVTVVGLGDKPSQEKIIILSSVARDMREGFVYNPMSWIGTAHASHDGLARLNKLTEQLENDCNNSVPMTLSEPLLPSEVGEDYFRSIFSGDDE